MAVYEAGWLMPFSCMVVRDQVDIGRHSQVLISAHDVAKLRLQYECVW